MTDYTPHPPLEGLKRFRPDIFKALDDYDRKVADGTLTFDAEGFVPHPPDTRGNWIGANLALHVSFLDITPDGQPPYPPASSLDAAGNSHDYPDGR